MATGEADIAEYHSEHRVTYHDWEDCPAGKQIHPEHRQKGSAGRRLCKNCQNHRT
jgi:hypothetical protein